MNAEATYENIIITIAYKMLCICSDTQNMRINDVAS